MTGQPDAARDRLAGLVDSDVTIIDELIDQDIRTLIAGYNAAVAAVARVKALHDRWTRMGVSSGWLLSLSYEQVTTDLRRALAPATGTDAASGDGDG